MYVPLYNWTGFYVGAHFGGSFAHESDTLGALGLSTDPSGVLGGFQFGYNWQFAPSLLVGVEAEFSWTSASGTAGFGVPGFAGVLTSNHNWYDTLAGRLGFTQGALAVLRQDRRRLDEWRPVGSRRFDQHVAQWVGDRRGLRIHVLAHLVGQVRVFLS